MKVVQLLADCESLTVPQAREAIADLLKIERAIEALAHAGNCYDAESAAKDLATYDVPLTTELWEKFSAAFWANNQVHGGALPCKVLRAWFVSLKRSWPPAKPE